MTKEVEDIHPEGVGLSEVQRGQGEDERKAGHWLRGEGFAICSLFNGAVSDLDYVASND
jgi:hypothetical protein